MGNAGFISSTVPIVSMAVPFLGYLPSSIQSIKWVQPKAISMAQCLRSSKFQGSRDRGLTMQA